MHYYYAGLVLSAAIVLFFAFGVRRSKAHPSDWHLYEAFWKPPAVDGKLVCGPVMRRWRHDQWEYRRMTEEEDSDYESATIW